MDTNYANVISNTMLHLLCIVIINSGVFKDQAILSKHTNDITVQLVWYYENTIIFTADNYPSFLNGHL